MGYVVKLYEKATLVMMANTDKQAYPIFIVWPSVWLRKARAQPKYIGL